MEIRNLCKSFGDNKVISNFSLVVPDKKITTLMGASGCGKTTLLNIIAGIVKADSGEIYFSGNVSYIFQEDRLLPWLTAEENIKLVIKKSAQKNIKKIFEELEIQSFLDKMPAELSGGMKQRISIARALVYDYEVLLMDEALKGLNTKLKERVINLIKQESNGKTVLAVTHDLYEAQAFSAEIIIDLFDEKK